MSSTNKEFNSKKYLIEFLKFSVYKLETNGCLEEEYEIASRVLKEHADLSVTADDLSTYFGKSKDAVNSVIKRNVVEKPRRNVVLHSFKAFLKAMPTSWRKTN